MPTLTFCNPQPLKYCGKNTWPYYQNAFECIASKDNVSDFIESITFKNLFKGEVFQIFIQFPHSIQYLGSCQSTFLVN